MAETIVKGTYDTKKKRYVELSQDFVKEIKLDYVLPSDKKDLVTYKTENFDVTNKFKAEIQKYVQTDAENGKNIVLQTLIEVKNGGGEKNLPIEKLRNIFNTTCNRR